MSKLGLAEAIATIGGIKLTGCPEIGGALRDQYYNRCEGDWQVHISGVGLAAAVATIHGM